ncbi:MAG: helix-hairpin-helix domain-containing protein, partial [Planctomycetota bacterium]
MSLTNAEVANVFSEMGDMLAILGTDHNRARAFRRIARILQNLAEPLAAMVRNGRLIKVKGLGAGTVHRVKEVLRTGTCEDHKELTRKLPKGLRELLKIRGLGTTKVRVIYQNLRVASLDELEAAARRGDLARLPRIGIDQQARLLKEIEAYRQRAGRLPLAAALRFGDRMKEHLLNHPSVHAAELTGSARRGESTVGDLDFVVATEDLEATVARFVSYPDASEVLMQARTRGSIRLQGSGRQADIWCVPPGSFGAGLHAFSGSLLHVINIRKRGNARGLKISETGVHSRSDDRLIDPGQTEADVFAAVGLPFIAPELRQNVGEIELAQRGRLPTLIGAEDLRGDLHMHTTLSDGSASVRAMADAAL